MNLVLDFETRSAVTELKKTGPWPYAEHASTDVVCLAVKADDQPPWIWTPSMGARMNDALRWHIENVDEIHAFNIQFELAVWFHVMHLRYGFPELPLHKLRDTAAVAAMHALPRQLSKACEVMDLAQQKDTEGQKLMLKMCKPRAPRKAEWEALDAKFLGCPEYRGLRDAYFNADKEKTASMCLFAARNWTDRMAEMLLWHEDPADIERLCQYCLQDVEAEYALGQALGELPPSELEVFQHDIVINTRGIRVDVPMVHGALSIIEEHSRRLLAELDTLTSGTVRSPRQIDASMNWLASRGVCLDDMTADTVRAVLKGDLPAEARRFLEIRQSLGKSSTAKYEAALHMACADGRMRGFAMYHGASTGRYTGKGIQLQNLPRGVFDLGDEKSAWAFWRAVGMVRAGDLDGLIAEFGDPMPVLSSVIRPLLLAAEGHELLAADFSAIEGRGLAWLAGEEWVLDAYREYDTFLLDENGQRIPDGKGGFKRKGPDMYIITASKILGKPTDQITSKERKNPGKPGDLATGYQGGYNALTKFGATVPEESRAKWIAEWIRREVKDNEEAKFAFESYVAYGGGNAEEALRALKDQGWPYPNEDELFEIWGRDVVNKWRVSRPKTVALWKGLETAAIKCVETGEPRSYGRVTYCMEGTFCTCELPSSRKLYYPFPKLANREMTYDGRTYSKLQFSHMTVDAETKQWVRRFAHGGLLAENITQAVCRDILVASLLRLERAGFPIVLHVHDEAVAEVALGTRSLEEFEAVMTVVPTWAEGFPISAAGWVGERYRKD
jgi:DNA polymerase bacteriophage-type